VSSALVVRFKGTLFTCKPYSQVTGISSCEHLHAIILRSYSASHSASSISLTPRAAIATRGIRLVLERLGIAERCRGISRLDITVPSDESCGDDLLASTAKSAINRGAPRTGKVPRAAVHQGKHESRHAADNSKGD
jgi:hypothetical protein